MGAEPILETTSNSEAERLVYHNASRPLDVSGDGLITPLDALLAVNELNARRLTDYQGQFLVRPTGSAKMTYLDTNGDGRLTPLDVLLVINWLNTRSAGKEGEAEGEGEGEGEGEERTAVVAPWSVPASAASHRRVDAPSRIPISERRPATDFFSTFEYGSIAEGPNNHFANDAGVESSLLSADLPDLESALSDIAADIGMEWRKPK